MKKIFVLDTNVLLIDPLAINKFGTNNEIYIPLTVIEELDKFKKDQNENGKNARYFSRLIDELRQKGSLFSGVTLDNGCTLSIKITKEYTSDTNLNFKVNDNLILKVALDAKSQADKEVILITKDINLRLKADSLEVKAEDYSTSHIETEEQYTGIKEFKLSEEELNKFTKEKKVDLSNEQCSNLLANEYLKLIDSSGKDIKLLARFNKKDQTLVHLVKPKEGIWGIHPKNIEQQCAFDALLNKDIHLVSLVGKAGTGKTLLAIAAALEATITKQQYSKVLVSRPIVPMGRDLGFLPGDVNEKMAPWMQPIFDNIDFLFGNQGAAGSKNGNSQNSWDELVNQGLLQVEPLTYIRGRSLPNQFMIIDEAQNLTPHEIKTIITRAGEGTKIVLTGDSEQIDNPYLDALSNGLNYTIEKMKQEELVAHIKLTIGERSALSEIATKLL